MEQDTHNLVTQGQALTPTSSTVHSRLWWMELVRGVIAGIFGLLCLVARSFAPHFLMISLGIYLVVDGLLELYGVRKRKITSPHRGHGLDCVGAAASLLIGVLCLLFPNKSAQVLAWIIALFLIISGASQMRQGRGVPGSARLFSWVSHGVQILLGFVLLLFPTLFMTFLLLFLGCYLVLVGISLSLKGLSLRFPSRSLPSAVMQHASGPGSLKQRYLPSMSYAIVFIRRAGARGLGHIGWGFERRNGWFLVGAAENRSGKPFAKPGEMGFWSALTRDPLATMAHWKYPYDEYKLFIVPQSHPKEAWKTVIWESQEPYSFVHHNCCDVAYEILHTYGCTEVLDPAQEYVPNDWYDALPGTSSPLMEYPIFLVSLSRQPQREIALVIPLRAKDLPPLWHSLLRRPWEELALMGTMVLGHIRTRLLSIFTCIMQHLRHDPLRS